MTSTEQQTNTPTWQVEKNTNYTGQISSQVGDSHNQALGILNASNFKPANELGETEIIDITYAYERILGSNGNFFEALPLHTSTKDIYLNPKKWTALNLTNTQFILNEIGMNGDLYTNKELEEITIKIAYYLLTNTKGSINNFHNPKYTESFQDTIKKIVKYTEGNPLIEEALNRFMRDYKIISQ
ncbi:hypothetical protein A9Q91_00695 [Candidatus Gracilibacteria bacterium 28_42_T64]|nr:hypothetical protein A9Q91_00695 [Candidatus Gracilibacteria bacterium 28_42_T64]